MSNQSSETQRVRNSFVKGMWQDSLPSLQPPQTYREAWNAVLTTEEAGSFGISNEGATELCAKIPDGFEVRGHHLIEERNWHIVFLDNGGFSEIGYIDTDYCTYNKIIDDNDIDGCGLEFGLNEWIPIESKAMQYCNELHLYWSNGMTYKRLNIDNIPEDLNCDTIKLFQCNCSPRVEVRAIEQNGSELYSGAYVYGIQLEDRDGNTTNVFETSKTVYVGSENNRPGQMGNESIRISVDDLPPNYDKVNIYFIRKVGGNNTAFLLTTQHYNTDGVEYLHRNKDDYIREVPISDILVKKNGYIRGKDLIQFQNRLFLYNISGEVNLDYQERALNIEPRYKVGRVPLKYAKFHRGLRGDEVVSVSIWFNFCDGTRTKAFHIHNKLATQGQAPFHAPEEDCPRDPWVFGNNAVRTSTLGHTDPEDIQETISRGHERGDDSYDRYTPAEVGALSEDDAAIPNVTEHIDALNSGGEGDGDCDCEIYCSMQEDARRILAFAFTGTTFGRLGPKPATSEEIKAAYDIAVQTCDCDCDRDVVVGPRSSSTVSYNDEDVERVLNQLELDAAVSGGAVTEQLVRDVFDDNYNYDPSGPGLEATLRSETEDINGRGSGRGEESVLDCGNGGGTVPEPEPGNEDPTDEDPTEDDPDGGGGIHGDDLTGSDPGTFSTPETEDADCGDGVPSDGTVPEGGYGNNPTTTNNVGDTFSDHRGNNSGTRTGTFRSESVGVENDCKPQPIYGEDGCTIVGYEPCIFAEGIPSYWESKETYPLTKNCDGGYIYGDLAGKPIRHIKMPSRDIEPHFVSYQDGVPNVNNMDNEEEQDGYAHYLWLDFSNIEMPTEDELPKPLCSKHPFTIGITPRNQTNKSVGSSGLVINTFKGDVYGETRLYPRHSVNSVETLDRFISNDDSRIGNPNTDTPAYVYHSPDTTFDKPDLRTFSMLNFEMDIYGSGYRHGLYAEGFDDGNFFTGVEHQKGARASIFLNRYRTDRTRRRMMKAAGYVNHNRVGDKGDDFTYSLVNLHREACVYLETDTDGPESMNTQYSIDGRADTSFTGDVLTHDRPIFGSAMYATSKKYRPRQYGSLVNAIYVPLHQGTKEEAEAGTAFAKDGDSFIDLYSVKRPSYISDRVGDDLNPPFEYDGGISDIKILGKLLKFIFSTVGAEKCGTVPQSGNLEDPRNQWNENGLRQSATVTTDGVERDTYYPTISHTLVTFPVESDVNLSYRGSGETRPTSTYRNLNGQNLDSSFANGEGSYKNSWLDRYYSEMSENSGFKMLARVLLNFIFTYGVGVYFMIMAWINIIKVLSQGMLGFAFSNPFTIISALLMSLALFILGFLWIKIWTNTDLDNRFIDSFLGISFCYPDRNNGNIHWMRDARVHGLEDNYIEYNYDYSSINEYEVNFGLTDPYNTCDCLGDTTNEVVYSNPQVLDSVIDSYRNYKVNNYNLIPAHYGDITKMFRFQGNLFLQTTDQMFNLRASRLSIGEDELDVETIALQDTDVVLKPIPIFDGPPEGRGGNMDPNALRVFPFGVVYVDRKARDIYIFNGKSQKSILPDGMKLRMQKELFFESLEENPGLPFTDEKSTQSVWYDIGYDPRYQRILVTKNDRLGDCDTSFTISYYPTRKIWASYHNYIPRTYAYDRFNMFSFDDKGLWRHNSHKKYQTFYDEFYTFYVEYSVNDIKFYNSFFWNYQTIDTECYTYREDVDDYIRNSKVTFDEIMQYNSYQNSGKLELVDKSTLDKMEQISDDQNKSMMSFIHRRWRINQVKDKLKDFDEPMFLKNCKVAPRIIDENNLLSESHLYKDKFYDNYLVIGLNFSKFDDKRLIFKFADNVIENRSE